MRKLGWTWAQLHDTPDYVVEQIIEMLAVEAEAGALRGG